MSEIREVDPVCPEIITQTPELLSIFQYIHSVAKSLQPILITGEPGAGKRRIARCVHETSGVPGDLVRVDTARLDDQRFSKTLFGCVQGAASEVEAEIPGRIEAAAGGTLYLDEIGCLSPESQRQLLRLIQHGEYVPVGAETTRRSDACIVTSTHVDLWELQRTGGFRKDLNFRIRTHHVHVPSLRERIDDLPLLVNHFLEEAARAFDKKKPTPPKELFILLQTYAFPRNVAELKEMIYEAVDRHTSKVLSLDVFKEHMEREERLARERGFSEPSPFRGFKNLPTLKQASQLLVEEAMRRANGNQSIAARMLGISQPALSKRLKTEAQKIE